MKLRRLQITRLPGIDEPFEIDAFDAGLVVVHGPNGIGKSSLCRAIRTLLWPGQAGETSIIASATFDTADGPLKVSTDGGQAHWHLDGRESAPPTLPALHLRDCFFLQLRDLLDDSPAAGQSLADRVRHQMAGGFDLDSVLETRFAAARKKSPGRRQRIQLDAAQREVHSAERAQIALAGEEGRLTQLAKDAERAREAREQRDAIEAARDLIGQRRALEQVEAELAGLPPALARATGGELERLEPREADILRCADERRQHVRALEAAREGARACGLEAQLDPEALDRWQGEVDALRQSEIAISAATAARDAAGSKCAEVSRRIGAPDESIPELAGEDAGALFDFLDEAQRIAVRRHEHEVRRDLPGAEPLADAERERLILLGERIAQLREWLREPGPGAAGASDRRGARVGLWVAAALTAAIGSVLAFGSTPWFAGLAGIGVGLAIGLLVLGATRRRSAPDSNRSAIERRLDTALGPPTSWTPDRVAELLRNLERERDEQVARASAAGRRADERLIIESELESIAQTESTLDERRQTLLARIGLDDLPSDARLVAVAREVDAYLASRREQEAASASLATVAAERDALLSRLGDALARHGGAAPTNANGARAAVAELARRDQALRTAQLAEATASEAIERSDAEAKRARTEHDAVYHELALEVGDRRALDMLLADFGRYRELAKDRGVLGSQCQLNERRLVENGQAELLGLGDAALESMLADSESAGQRLESIRDEIARIESNVKRARSHHDLEQAICLRDDALHALGEARDSLLEAAAGELLIESVREEHETHQMPDVLARAGALFSLFTHHAYELRVPSGGADSFVARDLRADEDRKPAELSDGTRAQLILAARLAFAEEVEGDTPLPIFLDEALDHSDPERFDSIVRSLGRMVADQSRQIVYFTNDPADVARIQRALEDEGCPHAATVDLAEVRNRSTTVRKAAALQIAAAEQVPAPGDMPAEEYAVRIGVRPLDARESANTQHLYHLLWDALDALHLLVESHIDSVGQWWLLSRSGAPIARAAERCLGDDAEGQIDARAQLLEEFCAARAQGRGRPVDRDVIEQSETVSERYIDAVAAMARALDGDAQRVLDELRSPSVDHKESLKGMRGRDDNADKLEIHLIESGYLDPDPILSEADVTARVLASPAVARLPRGFAAEAARRWWLLAERVASGA